MIITVPEFDLSRFWEPLSAALSSSGPGLSWVWLALIVAAVVGVAVRFWSDSSRKNERLDAGLYCLISLLVAIPAFFGFLRILRYPTQPWYYIPLIGVVAVAIETALHAVAGAWWKSPARIALALAVVLGSLGPAWNVVHLRQTNLDLVAARLNAEARAGDVVLVVPWYFGITFQRYYHGSASWITLPPIEDHRFHRYDLVKSQMAAANPMESAFAAMTDALKAGNRIWIVGQLPALPSGQRPPFLVPAPFGSVNWDETAYLNSWSLQTVDFVRTNALTSEELPVSAKAPVNWYECVRLVVVQGWRAGR